MKSRDRISGAAWLVVRDAQLAEDIFQNVAIKAMTREICFDSDGAVLSWAFITARREGIDWLRRSRPEASVPSIELLEKLESEWTQESECANLRAEALRECLKELPDRSRRLLRLRYFDGLACQAVADELGTRLDAVYKRLSRVHQALRSCVQSRLTQTHAGEVADT